MKTIDGGVCASKGFKAAGIYCGIRKNKTKKDLALIFSEAPADTAALYTANLVKGAPLTVTKENLRNGIARAVICNSGNANTCNANGIAIAKEMCSLAAGSLGIAADDVVVASTGVIGQEMDITPIASHIDALAGELSENGNTVANEAIMTTDTKPKEIAVEFMLGGKVCHMGAMAKGSGMIHPNMATMLVFITSDAAITSQMLDKALRSDVEDTFHMTSVDGDTSTNDMVVLMANGLAGNEKITSDSEDFRTFMKALNTITVYLCRCIAGDGEGATKLLECSVTGAADVGTARTVAKGVICSSLTKAAMFGEDANWGRILCAIGYCGANVDVSRIGVSFASPAGTVCVCENGAGVAFSEELAAKILHESEIDILVDLGAGTACAKAWGCDLTYEYVKINGEYRT